MRSLNYSLILRLITARFLPSSRLLPFSPSPLLPPPAPFSRFLPLHLTLLQWKRTFELIPCRNPICLCVVTHVRDSWFLVSVWRTTRREVWRPISPSGKFVGFPPEKRGEGILLHQCKSGPRLLAIWPTFTIMAANLRITFLMTFPVKLLTMVSLDLDSINIISQVINYDYDVATQHTMSVRIVKSVYVLYYDAYTEIAHTRM